MKIERKSTERRTVLKSVGVGIGSVMLAGCVGTDDDGGADDDDTAADDGGVNDDDTAADDDGGADDDDTAADGLEEIEDWLNEEPNRLDVLAEESVEWGDGVWDGDIIDLTGENEVEVNFSAMLEVGGEVLGPFAADPIAVDIAPGTTVTWEWEDEHTLTSYFDPPHESPDDGAADEFAVEGDEEEESSHEHVFEEPGVYLYYCLPHGTPYETEFGPEETDGTQNWFGHRGAIRVVED